MFSLLNRQYLPFQVTNSSSERFNKHIDQEIRAVQMTRYTLRTAGKQATNFVSKPILFPSQTTPLSALHKSAVINIVPESNHTQPITTHNLKPSPNALISTPASKNPTQPSESRKCIRKQRKQKTAKPKSKKNLKFSTGQPTANPTNGTVCYLCGSHAHSLKACPQLSSSKRNAETGQIALPFAKCFVCTELGHLAGQCPQGINNPVTKVVCERSLCTICGSSKHSTQNCVPMDIPKLNHVGTITNNHSPDADDMFIALHHLDNLNSKRLNLNLPLSQSLSSIPSGNKKTKKVVF